jgi:uncharacterized OB-fold protein
MNLVEEIRQLERNQMIERIKRLEDALQTHNLPLLDSKCPCCGKVYIPYENDSIRCSMCCISCRKEGKNWVKGPHCPSFPVQG